MRFSHLQFVFNLLKDRSYAFDFLFFCLKLTLQCL
jgi:hypothetical protein